MNLKYKKNKNSINNGINRENVKYYFFLVESSFYAGYRNDEWGLHFIWCPLLKKIENQTMGIKVVTI